MAADITDRASKSPVAAVAVLYYDDMDDIDENDRTHFIDNLRATLVATLIVQHAINETAATSYPHFDSLPLSLFVLLSKTVVPGLFFLISGYASSITRITESSGYYGGGRSDAEFIWRKTIRLLLPALVYGGIGHVVLWMVLTKSLPSTFFDGGPLAWSFSRLEGPIAYLAFLYLMDMAYVSLFPARRGASPLPSEKRRSQPRSFETLVKSKRDWYTAVLAAVLLLSIWTFLVAASGRTDQPTFTFPISFAAYDPISPVAPFQYIFAYMAGARLYKWQNHILIPYNYAVPAFALSLVTSLGTFILAHEYSPSLQKLLDLNTPSAIHPSFVDGGFNLHTLFYAVWTTCSFVAISLTLVSIFAHSGWTRRDWGVVTKHCYLPVWLHMLPIAVLTRSFAADEGRWGELWERGVEWRCFLVSGGSVLFSWVASFFIVFMGRILSY
ncbi:hypothetical protein CC1G_02663 [Coprinopsis cinerea okayama7|uniref:Acyltransferase 3 domain-containing protein n=1 Tax=Coprinopsis cinerea (strain Okayama-7 / 130 / ATCC MYA-4618 / FGSC 9003) TaxID=240176 RepID=A8PBJ7_COPC7|nr:hypothetical protein CC1G_02663 [Coprinopsis cinerea okayama7\|eukprot:XP_001840200.2 hypothetical protein CC1G_02663 [Coprinopsis cinerea okayama7\